MEHLEDRRMLAGRAAEAINTFAIDLYEQMQREGGNLFFSPLSIATGMAMAYAGAAGQTAAEIEQVLRFGDEPGIHASFAELLDSIKSHNEIFAFPKQPHVLTSANAIWPDNDLSVVQAFLDVMQGEYEAHVQTVDYNNPQQAENTINSWVSGMTAGKIPHLVSDLSPMIRMVLTNAAYFNGYWEKPFDPRFSGQGPFTLADGQSVVVSTMYTEMMAPYAVFDGFSVLELPFDGGAKNADYSMVLILPPENGATSLPSQTFAKIDAWLNGPQWEQLVLINLPKTSTSVSTSLKEMLAGMGMPTAFELGAADFSGMTPEQVAITKVFHQATLTMNEQGTTAAAATQVDFGICFAAGTPVLTPQGAKPIEELQVGDLVLARDENNVAGDVSPRRIEKTHQNHADVLELYIAGQVIRTTAPHPFFVQGKGWMPAGELRPQDMLATESGSWVKVDGLEYIRRAEPVYNLRVADLHTYFVGRQEWKFALWVHNACSGFEPEFFADRPYHLLIRDNITSTIAFMGRIDNPLQAENDVSPAFVGASADFDGNLRVDGADFLAWQRGFGAQNPTAASGDADRNGTVDANDLAEWKQAFGPTTPPPATTALQISDKTSLDAAQQPGPYSITDYIDAALALAWLSRDVRIDEALIVDDGVQAFPQFKLTAVANEPDPLAASVAFDSLALSSVDELAPFDGVWDDEILEVQFQSILAE
ncbi:serpin family protein [Lacipirellula limnantheis]|uniref:Serpin (Serine protease inhibitor) n=1 Tax=Lacipirellula limnantheis TaxID=2528024 RepID=A0A517U4U9_9BACT|nr:serpin family protein [Lacipirellula limnantheis]QDT75656.1 Serpin (serine protease inhibitor) [Lacipirellula limnantheis]